MHLYDTGARTVRPFQPPGDAVSLYVCGITPYDAAHLGHAFTYHVFDVVTRRLRAAGRQVKSVRNVTDVDDDIFRVARQRGVPYAELVAEQVARFDREMASIDILPVTAAPLASEHVPSMVRWIERLEREGAAYARDGWVYFDVSTFDRYGALSGLSRDEMLALSRERGADPDDPRKSDPLDFVLWQPSLADESSWESPWGMGRPGWHIECSVLATDLLGDTVDLHGGGDDLIYPHHESEIAQVEAISHHPFVRHWMHVAMVQLDGVKMSKSLGNLVFVGDCLRRCAPGSVRLALAAHHYRTAWSFVAGELDDAEARRIAYRDAIAHGAALDPKDALHVEQEFFARLDDDLDTPGALRVLDDLASHMRDAGSGRSTGADGEVLMRRLLGVLGADVVPTATPAATPTP
ncbi:MAG TPA: cysteine--tRNA ligase [Candidatus Dormibacteraeota bacterium]|jgi:L-cysteine:1D-myo-inositol 2-amino-2-deoxy-alpha-D-glucopyranoside ligase|nr:cysteine--tRNA ligase [Candidatus Dormibacteraeota bacterium]